MADWVEGQDGLWRSFASDGTVIGPVAAPPFNPGDNLYYMDGTHDVVSGGGVGGGFTGTGIDLITAAGQATGSTAGNGLPGLGAPSQDGSSGFSGWWLVAFGIIVLAFASSMRR